MTTGRESPQRWFGLARLEVGLLVTLSAAIVLASTQKWWSIGVTEAWGFATGGICVWLLVREHLWNWPVGLANNVFFFVLFFHSRLYADMVLQVFYFGLGVYGWRNWLAGGQGHGQLPISRTTPREWWLLVTAIPVATWGLRAVLLAVNGAAPLGDAMTTILSLAAMYLQSRKRLENWWLWIAADVIYIPLYWRRELVLTAVLYAVFLLLCVIGARDWQQKLQAREPCSTA